MTKKEKLLQKKQIQEKINRYMSTLSKKEKIAYKIAKSDLKSSFDIEKSIGFLSWLKKNKV